MVADAWAVRAGASPRLFRARSRARRAPPRAHALGLGGVDSSDPCRVRGGELFVGRGDPGVELVVLALEPVEPFAADSRPRAAERRLEGQQQRAIGRQPAGGELVDLAHRLDSEPPARRPDRRARSRRTGRAGPTCPRSSSGSSASSTSCARAAAYSSASARGTDRQRRVLDQLADPLGRAGRRPARAAARSSAPRARSAASSPRASVVLPAPSIPSIVIRRPRVMGSVPTLSGLASGTCSPNLNDIPTRGPCSRRR